LKKDHFTADSEMVSIFYKYINFYTITETHFLQCNQELVADAQKYISVSECYRMGVGSAVNKHPDRVLTTDEWKKPNPKAFICVVIIIIYVCYLILFCWILGGSRDSSVGIATGYGLDGRGVGVRVTVGSRIFSTSSRPALRPTQPPIQWVPAVLSPGVKRQGREADQPPASAEFN
jgi:hypothetical protein